MNYCKVFRQDNFIRSALLTLSVVGLSSGSLGSLTHLPQQIPAVNPQFGKYEGKHSIPPGPEEIRKSNAQRKLFERAIQSFQNGEYEVAKEGFLSLRKGRYELVPSATAIWLARTYAKLNDDEGAYSQLHMIFYPPKNSTTSYRTDPVTLVFYADLCARLHKPEEADKAYYEVSRISVGYFPDPMKSMLQDTDPDAPTKALRSNALAVAAFHLTGKPSLMMQYAEEAVAVAPSSAMARFAYATLLRERVHGGYKLAMAQYWKAERLAEEPFASMIHEYREKNHVYFGSSIGTNLQSGRFVEHDVAYSPTSQVSTPHFVGFKTVLPLD